MLNRHLLKSSSTVESLGLTRAVKAVMVMTALITAFFLLQMNWKHAAG
ncbi:MAG: hypothetical protein ACOH2T_26975 [Pseudomonas sp.]